SGCGFRIEPVPNTFYIEVHHVRPLGGEHAGTDIQANMLVLCPNHHAMFDYGIPRFLSPQRIEIEGVTYDIITKHGLSSDSMEYHNIKRQNRTC
ncbi:MAG: HNH endonuclease, partial [Verrucomicrobiota bacterium]